MSAAITLCDTVDVLEYSARDYRAYAIGLGDDAGLRALADIPEGVVRWVNIDGACPEHALRLLGGAFGIHPLVIESIPDQTRRAKIEEYRESLHIIAKMLYFSENELVAEHMNFVLGPRYVITFGETKGDVFDDLRARVAQEDCPARASGADYLLYLMLDAMADGYFSVLETFKEEIDALEDRIMANTMQEHLQEIRELKKHLMQVSKYIWPLRDVASLLDRESMALIRPSTEPYLRDVYNHIVQAIDTTETCRDLLSGLADLHLSNTSYRLNEIMKVLTIISTIFIPLTFIVGVYGMNFAYMPELRFRWGYALVWIVMLVITAWMIYFFKKKKWL